MDARETDGSSAPDPAAGAGRVTALWIAGDAGEPMTAVDAVRAVPGGLAGDRYLTGEGYYAPFDGCEVTLVAGEALDAISEEAGLDLSGGEHRRNVVTRGVDLSTLLETRFRVGGAVLEGTRPRPPCRHVEDVAAMPGLMDALRDRGGICADVVEAGRVAVGDEIEPLADLSFDADGLAAAIRERAEER